MDGARGRVLADHSYVVTARSTSGTVKETVAPDATSTTITGLTNGVQYVFYVAAVNAAGTGPAASSQPATPIGYPTAPNLVSATGDDSSLTLSWKPPTNDGGSAVTLYVAQVSTATSDWVKAPLSDGGTISGLTNGTEYSVRIAAVNAAGRGMWSNALTATPIAAPDAPSAVTVVPGDGSAAVSWQPPAEDGGSPITGYRVIYRAQTAASGGWTPSNDIVDAAPVTVTGLQNGTVYQFRVVAMNAAGAGLASSRCRAHRSCSRRPPLPAVRRSPAAPSLPVTWSTCMARTSPRVRRCWCSCTPPPAPSQPSESVTTALSTRP